MLYIDPAPNPSGAYPNPKNQSFPGCITLNDQQAQVFLQYRGFVAVTLGADGAAQSVQPNQAAYDAWLAEHPQTDPPPTEVERLRADVDYIAIMTGVELV